MNQSKTSHKLNIVPVKEIKFITSIFAKMLTFIQRYNVEDDCCMNYFFYPSPSFGQYKIFLSIWL